MKRIIANIVKPIKIIAIVGQNEFVYLSSKFNEHYSDEIYE